MSFFDNFWDNILHIDKTFDVLVDAAPILSYIILFLVIFAETAFIVTAFLPSDVVLFTACSYVAVSKAINPFIIIPMFFVAALLGDSVNFSIGRLLKKKVNKNGSIFFIKKESLEKTNKIFERSGATSVICARFVPLLRSLVPFVTGVSDKQYKWFFQKNLIGVFIWTVLYCTLGFLFGNLTFVKEHFGVVTLGITAIIIIAGTFSFLVRKFLLNKKNK